MAVTEAAKHKLYQYLEETMGEERATTLMELASPAGWVDVATKQDLSLLGGEMSELRTELKREMAALQAELQGEMAELRTDLNGKMDRLQAELQGEMAELRTDLNGKMDRLQAELKGETGGLRTELTSAIEQVRLATRSELDIALRTHTMATFGFFGIFMSLAVTLVR